MASRHPVAYRRMLARLRSAREEAGLTQVDVARELKAPQQYVSRIELGERRLDPLELQELALLYRKPVEWFLASTD